MLTSCSGTFALEVGRTLTRWQRPILRHSVTVFELGLREVYSRYPKEHGHGSGILLAQKKSSTGHVLDFGKMLVKQTRACALARHGVQGCSGAKSFHYSGAILSTFLQFTLLRSSRVLKRATKTRRARTCPTQLVRRCVEFGRAVSQITIGESVRGWLFCSPARDCRT